MNKRRLGAVYEKLAQEFLEHQGYKVIETNYRCRIGEVDIIARDGCYLCYIEVKYRGSTRCGDPLESIDGRKQRRIVRAAQYYMMTHGISGQQACRFDAVGILKGRIFLVKNAFGGI